MRRTTPLVLVLSTLSAIAAAPLPSRQAPLPAMPNPPGDIPDSQAFVTYQSPLGFALKAPEGWARRTDATGVTFSDRYGGVAVQLAPAPATPTPASVRTTRVAELSASPDAVEVSKVEALTLPAGPAVRIDYALNSAPNPVTGKAIRQEAAEILFWNAGRLATLTLTAPFGADNVDQWKLMQESFRWR